MKGFVRLVETLRAYPGRLLASIVAGTASVASSVGLLTVSAYLISSAALHGFSKLYPSAHSNVKATFQ